MKKALFWIVSPLSYTVFFIACILEVLGVGIQEVLYKFEGWSFDYNKISKYIGEGIWTDKED